MYLLPGSDPASGPFARGVDVRGGKALSYNNLLDAAAAAAIARDLRGAACTIVKHANPCGAAEARDGIAAWEGALAGDPVSAFGGVVALTVPIDAALAERLVAIFLEVVIAPGVDPAAAAILAGRADLRVIVDPHLGSPPVPGREVRSAGGAVLVTDADVEPDDPSTWSAATSRRPSPDELRDLDLAWRVARHVKSNAIVLVRGGAVVGVGAGQMSRVDSARLACEKAGERSIGAVCASDAFFPFADAVEVCLAAGVTGFVQPGGSRRDAEVIAAAEAAGRGHGPDREAPLPALRARLTGDDPAMRIPRWMKARPTLRQPPDPTAAAGDEAASGTADAGPAAEAADGATPEAEGWAAQLQRMIDDIGRQAVPVIREVAAKAAELAAVAGEKAGPFAQKAAEKTAEFGAVVAARGHEMATDLRRSDDEAAGLRERRRTLPRRPDHRLQAGADEADGA